MFIYFAQAVIPEIVQVEMTRETTDVNLTESTSFGTSSAQIVDQFSREPLDESDMDAEHNDWTCACGTQNAAIFAQCTVCGATCSRGGNRRPQQPAHASAGLCRKRHACKVTCSHHVPPDRPVNELASSDAAMEEEPMEGVMINPGPVVRKRPASKATESDRPTKKPAANPQKYKLAMRSYTQRTFSGFCEYPDSSQKGSLFV